MKKLGIITILLILIARICFAAASDYKVDNNGNIYGYGLHILTTGTFLNILSGAAYFQTPLGISSGGTGTNVAISMVNSFNTRTGVVSLTAADVASVYTGSTNLTILGTIATGTVPWSHVSGYSTVNDTNVTLSISSSGAHTVGWTGTLADGRIASASTWNAKQNAVAANAPLSFSTPTMSISLATTTVDGYISAASYSTFNAKQSALNGAYVASFNSSTGNITTPTVNDTNVTLSMASGQTQTLTAGWTGTLADSRIASAATWNGKQNDLNGAYVASFNTRTGAVSLTSADVASAYTGSTNLTILGIVATTPLSFSTPTISISTSPSFSTVVLSNLTTSYVPVAGASGLVDSGIYYDGTHIGFGSSIALPLVNTFVIRIDQNAPTSLLTQNSNTTGTSAYVQVVATTDSPEIAIQANGKGRTATRYGLPLGNAMELITFGTHSYLLIGTGTENIPIIFGTNGAQRMRIGGTGGINFPAFGSGVLVSDSSGTVTSSSSPSISGLTTSGTVTAGGLNSTNTTTAGGFYTSGTSTAAGVYSTGSITSLGPISAGTFTTSGGLATTGTVTGGNFYTAGTVTAAFFSNILSGTTSSMPGGTISSAGTCTTTTASITGATVGMVAQAAAFDGVVTPCAAPLRAEVTATGTVTVYKCAITASCAVTNQRFTIRIIQ